MPDTAVFAFVLIASALLYAGFAATLLELARLQRVKVPADRRSPR